MLPSPYFQRLCYHNFLIFFSFDHFNKFYLTKKKFFHNFKRPEKLVLKSSAEMKPTELQKFSNKSCNSSLNEYQNLEKIICHWRPVTLMFFKKTFGMLSQCLVLSITKKVSSYSLVLGQHPLTALQIQNFIKVFQCILKSLETF